MPNFRSAFCSLSVIGRTTMITPTPRAISPQDIVRIYVPPAPPDEQKLYQDVYPKAKTSPSTKDSKPNSISVSEANHIQKHQNNNNKIISSNASLTASPDKTPPANQTTVWPTKTLTGFTHETNRNSMIYGSGDLTPVHCAFNRSDDDLVKSFADASLSTNSNSLGYIGIGGASSSSRRGSLSRKSPSAMFESNILMECSHMIKRRLSNQSNSSINFEVRDKSSPSNENASNKGSQLSLRLNTNGESQRKMTSFEQLAASRFKGNNSDEKLSDEIDKYSPDDEENYSYSYYKYKSAESRQRKSPITVENSKRFVSESNVQYESLSMRKSSKEIEYQALNKRRPNSSGNETSLFQYEAFSVAAPHKSTSIKEYKRFYGTSNEDTCDEEIKKSSDESSSSPNCKSVQNSPETIPLLQSSPPSHIPVAKLKSPVSPTQAYAIGLQSDLPSRPSRIPVMHSSERKMSAKFSPTAHMSPTGELNRILPPVEVVSSSQSSSNNSLSSRKLSLKSPTSPNGQPILFASNRPMKLQTKNGTTLADTNNTIRIKVNQNDK